MSLTSISECPCKSMDVDVSVLLTVWVVVENTATAFQLLVHTTLRE